MFNDTRHDVIHTGGNVYNDYISDFDSTGRVIVVAESGIYLFANDRDYQLQLDPITLSSSPDKIDEYLPEIEENSQIADIESTTQYVFVRDTAGATLTVYRNWDH